MKRYNKLVRDKIPEHLKSLNKRFIAHIADDNEYYWKLKEKLIEEVTEFLRQSDVEELADIQEVVDAILDYKRITKEDFKKIKDQKRGKRGAFKKRIILRSADE